MKQWLARNKNNIVISLLFIAVIGVIIGFATLIIFSTSKKVNTENFIITGKYTLLDLGATSCEPCKRLQPVLAELREEYGEKIDIVFYDISNTKEGANLANTYKVNIMPTLLFVDKNGKEIKREIGFQSKEQIVQIFKELGWI